LNGPFDPQDTIKKMYKAWGTEDPRVIMTKFLVFPAPLQQDPTLANFAKQALTMAVAAGVATAKRDFLLAEEHAAGLADFIKTTRGDNDLFYATALEFVGDLQTLQDKYASAAISFARVLEIRRGGLLGSEKPQSIIDPRSDYTAKRDLRRIMSKLADTSWIIGKSDEAAALRSDPQSRQGDADRIADLENADGLLQSRKPLHPDHPSCVARFAK
jgi:hypothetical protein